MIRNTPFNATPPTPGEVLREYVIAEPRITQDTLAEAMKVSRLTINQLMNGRRSVTAEMALRLAHVLGTTPEFWLNLQRDADLEEAPKEVDLKQLRVLRKPAAQPPKRNLGDLIGSE